MTFFGDSWRNPFNNTGITGEHSVLQRGPFFIRVAKTLAARAHFAPFVAVGGAWLVWPALTPNFKYSIGVGPNPEPEE